MGDSILNTNLFVFPVQLSVFKDPGHSGLGVEAGSPQINAAAMEHWPLTHTSTITRARTRTTDTHTTSVHLSHKHKVSSSSGARTAARLAPLVRKDSAQTKIIFADKYATVHQ